MRNKALRTRLLLLTTLKTLQVYRGSASFRICDINAQRRRMFLQPEHMSAVDISRNRSGLPIMGT